MTTSKIRWGILATGGIAATFTEDLLLLDDAEVAAVGSRTPEAARAFADRYGIPRAHGSWAELAADPDVDIVYVATPHSAHLEAAALCLDAGKAVLCEKPITLNTAQAEDLMRRARDNNVFLMEAMWTRTVPAVLRAMEIVREGGIGDIVLLQADFSVPLGVDDPAHRVRDPRLGGGALLDIGIYPVALSQLVLGAPSTIQSVATLTDQHVDETTAMTLTHPGGALSALTCSIAADGTFTASIAGTKGRIDFRRPWTAPNGFTLTTGDTSTWVDVPYIGQGMAHEAIEAMRCLREGLLESPLAPWSETLGVMATMDEVRRQVGVVYPGE
jgi:predicted dehydrogenase